MRNRHLFSSGKTYGILLAVSVFLFGSCTQAIDSEYFSSDVQNATLDAPEITAMASPSGTETILSWPVIMGAGGVKMSLYNVEDANNPIPIVVDTIIDGSTVKLPRTEDTNYRLVVQTLGNEKYNNKPSEEKEFMFSSWVPKINAEPLPAGTDIAQWFTDNAALVKEQKSEFSVELQAGAEYTMSSVVELDTVPFVLYANSKETNATIKMGTKAGFSTESGIKLKFLNIDCTGMTDKESSVIAFSKTPIRDKVQASSNPSWNLDANNPVVLKHVFVKDMKSHLIWTNNLCYTVNTILLDNCIIGLDQVQQQSNGGNTIDMSSGFVYNLTIQNSTIYSTTDLTKNGAFVVISSNRPQQYLNGAFPTSQFNYLNSTWVNVSKGSSGGSVDMFSYGRLKGQKCHTTITRNNIFLNCSSNRVARRGILQNQNGGMITEFENNCYWYNGANPGNTDWDKGDRVSFDPALTQTAVGYYTVGGAEVKAAKCGDPRGLQ